VPNQGEPCPLALKKPCLNYSKSIFLHSLMGSYLQKLFIGMLCFGDLEQDLFIANGMVFRII